MTDTNQLPEPELGYIQTDKSNQPAFSARQMREAMKHALRPERVPMTDDQISLEAHNADDRDWNDLRFRSSWHEGFLEGARFAEAHHGITAHATQVEMTDDVVRDAERYRYLRDIRRRDSIVLSGPEAGVWCDAEDEDGTLLLLTEDDLDAAIDDAMLAAKEGTNGEIN